MCDLVARTGRHQQRYKDGYRLVAGWRKCKNFMGGDSEGEFDGSRFFEVSWCIPYRYKSCEGDCDDDDPMRSVEVLMINSQSGPGLLFPKGGWENDETVKEAAVREAVEEAGVRGDLKKFLGFYCFKSKSHQDEFSPEGWCKAAMYALLVNEELLSWPEQSTRERKWLPVCEAVERCRHKWMEGVLDAFSKWLANQASGVEEEDPISAPSSPLR